MLQATVLIETLPAAFEMEEILYELKEHSAGLNCGRWDYIFSLIKTLREDPDAIMPDRSAPAVFLDSARSESVAETRFRGVYDTLLRALTSTALCVSCQ